MIGFLRKLESFDLPLHYFDMIQPLISIFLLYSFFSILWNNINRSLKAKAAGCEEPLQSPISGFLGFNGLRVFVTKAAQNILPEYFVETFNTYGNTIHWNIFGVGNSIFTAEPEIIKAVLARNFESFSTESRRVALQPLVGSGVFNSDGESWKSSRALLRPQFAKKTIANLEKIERHFVNFISRASQEIEEGDLTNGGKVDLYPILQRLALDSATDFLLGHSSNSLLQKPDDIKNKTELPKEKGPYQFGFMDAFDRTIVDTMWAMRLGPFGKIIHWKKDFVESIRIVHTFFDHQIDIRNAHAQQTSNNRKTNGHEASHDNVLSSLLATTDDRTVIRDQLTGLLIAGRDTTSSVLSSLFYTFARNPRIYQKLRTEILATFGRDKEKFTYSSLKDCSYLQWNLNETLRIYPPVPQNNRTATKDTLLPTGGGTDGTSPIFITKGTDVFWSIYAMHRRKDLYGEDADQYIPERWDSTKRKQAPTWAYIPFGGGPRICLGQQYALTEIGYVVARMCQLFERVEPFVGEEDASFITANGLTMHNLNGCRVRLWRDGQTNI